MNILALIVQILLAFHTAMGAIWKFTNSEQVVPSLKAIPPVVWRGLIGFELICAVGLLLPLFHKPSAILVPFAAVFIAIEMLAFSAIHVASDEQQPAPMYYWLGVAVVSAFVAYAGFFFQFS